MIAERVGRSNLVGILIGLVMVGVGIVVMVIFPCIGWLIGAVMIVYGLFQGGKSRKVWRCPECGSIIERI